MPSFITVTLRCHNGHDSVSNHQPRHCLLSILFMRRSKKTSKLRVTGLCVGNSPGPVNSPRKGPVTRKMFPFDDVIMLKSSPRGYGRLPSKRSLVFTIWFILMVDWWIPQTPVMWKTFPCLDVIFTLGRHRRRRVLSSVIASVRPSVRPFVHPNDVTALTPQFKYQLSTISLKHGGMMHSTMEQVAIWNGRARPSIACSMELWIFPW